ncbi:hypothetical protein CHCC14600_1612 [Bacillus licheniformis]|nr:hypothetical protein CHCC19466_4636 [Bacillus licheniformis]TWL29747.1 hypothetical protein CHCC16874_4107 [Bacillus licheniformis]TWL65571.1 hypothetical protein CHCC15318_4405 [Bacillus licheniformis]TWL92273.1 hypothetical protein CHCC15291_1582 [Bacillus licheniformis]TWM03772.1 hypothetical protein CHCC15289_0486 [Bacillus licheniformis]
MTKRSKFDHFHYIMKQMNKILSFSTGLDSLIFLLLIARCFIL